MSQQAFLSSTYGTTAQVYEDKVRYKSFQLDNSILGKAEKAKLPAAADKKRLRCTAKQRRQQKLSAVPRKCSYDQFIPLNQLWKEYMHSSVLTKPNQREPNQALMARVLMADWHGAEMEVIESKCPTLVGLKGILVQELENVLKLITAADNRVKTIPKANSIFRMTCGDAISFTLYGAQLTCRSADRSVRKWKDRSTIELL